MRWVPAGTFQMGSPDGEAERDRDEQQHRVRLSEGFWIGEREVTQGLWEDVMGRNPVADPLYREHMGYGLVDRDHPVMVITWCEAVDFANKLSAAYGLEPAYSLRSDVAPAALDSDGCTAFARTVILRSGASGFRLPTEAEWEHAARAGRTARFGSTDRLREVCDYGNVSTSRSQSRFGFDFAVFPCEDPHLALAPVGSYRPNAWGLHDTIGNVWEWCWDWKRDYPEGGSLSTDPRGARDGDYKISRGGSWEEAWRYSRVANRAFWRPGDEWEFIGLRLVLPADVRR